MSKYYCECCQYDAKVKGNYLKHLKTKKHKKSSQSQPRVNLESTSSQPFYGNNEKQNIISPYQCKYCNKYFKFKQSMYKHIKYSCKLNEDEDFKELARLLNEQLQESNKKMENMRQSMQKQIDKLKSKLKIQTVITNHNTNHNNFIQNNMFNIKLLNHEDTDYSHLTHNDYITCINNCNLCVKTLIEKVHFNMDKPENMNIFISNIKGNYIMIYKEDTWQIEKRKERIDDLYDQNEMVLETWYDEYKEKYPHIINSFQRYLQNRDENDTVLNSVKDDILLLLYNKRTNHNIIESS